MPIAREYAPDLILISAGPPSLLNPPRNTPASTPPGFGCTMECVPPYAPDLISLAPRLLSQQNF